MQGPRLSTNYRKVISAKIIKPFWLGQLGWTMRHLFLVDYYLNQIFPYGNMATYFIEDETYSQLNGFSDLEEIVLYLSNDKEN